MFKRKILPFLKRNLVYIIVAFCILAIGLTVALVAINNQNLSSTPIETINDEPSPIEPTEDPVDNTPEVVVFTLPVADSTSTSDYSSLPVFNTTLNRYESHLAIDFFAPSGTKVLCAYDGTIESIKTDLLTGVTVVVDHGNGLKTRYNSIAETDGLTVGQTIKKGDVIGEVSDLNLRENKSGPHLHFETEENGVLIDPTTYFDLGDK